ncbi:hypothetical protein LC065_02400 [Halobacillus litoralis]|uniref:hypothetical protein n=1 Tax=Halobacillus litoralis TaxID=45668 RepID=UPI001CFCA24E|nr:hypothetical protein [Halobacillus litoralis]WLR48144.1 hypothetical protein LC065_02400 [Halobacillus litoralis]
MSEDIRRLDMTLEKVLIEVRYDKSLLFDEIRQLNEIAKQSKHIFTKFGRDERNGALRLLNPNKEYFGHVFSDRASVDIDNPESYEEFVEISSQTINEISNKLEIDEFGRIGVRFFVGKQFPSTEAAWECIKSKLLDMEDVFEGETVEHPNIQFVFVRGDVRLNVSVRVESVTSITFEMPTGSQKGESKDMILFDIDVYSQRTVKSGESAEFYQEAHGYAIDLLGRFDSKLRG